MAVVKQSVKNCPKGRCKTKKKQVCRYNKNERKATLRGKFARHAQCGLRAKR